MKRDQDTAYYIRNYVHFSFEFCFKSEVQQNLHSLFLWKETSDLGLEHWIVIQRLFSLIPDLIWAQIFLYTDWFFHGYQIWDCT